jgi:hypothetical protein
MSRTGDVHFDMIRLATIEGMNMCKPCESVLPDHHHEYRVIRKSLRDFRPLRYRSRDGHAEGEHVNRGRDTPSFCLTLPVLDISTLGDAADVNPLIKFLQSLLSTARCCNVCGRNLIRGLTSSASPRVDISCICKVGQKLGVSLPCWHAPLRRDLPGYCTTDVGNPRGTYELPCITVP